MSAVAPTLGPVTLATQPVATPGAIVVETNEAALAASAGNIVNATVVGRDARGAVQLRTQNGVILLQTQARLPVGAAVTLQIQAVGAQLQAVLLQVTPPASPAAGLPFDPASATTSAGSAAPAAGPAASAPAGPVAPPAPVTVGAGPTITAVVVGPPGTGGADDAAPPPGAPPVGPPVPAPEAPGTATGNAAPVPDLRPAAGAGPASSRAPSPTPIAPSLLSPSSSPSPSPSALPTSPMAHPPSFPAPPARPAAGSGAAPAVAGPLTAPLAAGPAPSPPAAAAARAAALRAAIPPGTPNDAASAAAATPTAAAPDTTAALMRTTARQPAGGPPAPAPGAPRPDTAPGAGAAAGGLRPATIVAPASVAATGGVAPGSATAPAASHAYAAAAAPALAPAASSAPAAGAPGAARATGAAAMPRGPLPPGSTIELRLAASGPSAGTAALAAMLVGRTPSGQGILDAAAGRMIVPLPAPLAGAAPGTRLTLEVVAWHAARGGADGAAQRAREADVVRPIADALAAIARASHGKVDTHDALPRPGPRLAQQLADTAAALATGRVADWLGRPAVETLERQGQGEMVRRLEQDLYQAAHGAPQTQDWRSLILPFMVGDTLRPLRFYVRQRHERARDRRQGTRFVVECEHDGLGTLQLDGMVQAKRIDLVLRSLGAVPARMQGDLTALFGDACGVMGYSGTLAFQAVPALPAMPRAEPAAGTVGVTA